MKNLFISIIFLIFGLQVAACNPFSSPTSTTIAWTTPTTSAARGVTPSPIATVTSTSEPTQTLGSTPTILPTIEPTRVRAMLNDALSLQRHQGINGHNLRQITGWNYGFRPGPCGGFKWLDSSHLLLYPTIGQERAGEGGRTQDLASQTVVIDLENGLNWLPHTNEFTSAMKCDSVYWSRELGLLITPLEGGVETYTPDGEFVATYAEYLGELIGVSPSGTKILVEDDNWIDLTNGKIIDFAWHQESDEFMYFPQPIWSSDETRIFTCCYHYGDARTSESYNFPHNDMSIDGKKVDGALFISHGEWVKNDSYLLLQWDFIYGSNPGFIPLFDPVKRTLLDLNTLANIPSEVNGLPNCQETSASPAGDYIWAECYTGNYLITLSSFESQEYPDYKNVDINWSADGRFALLESYDMENNRLQILSVSSKELMPLPANPFVNGLPWWHPTDNVLAYISEDGQHLELLNAQNMSVQELELPSAFLSIEWSPTGEHLALVAENGSIWQVDYPKLENLEQITPPLPGVDDVKWSPDGVSFAFVSGTDIYIVDAAR